VHVDCTPRSAKRAGGAGAGGGHAQAATRAPLSPAIEELSPQRALQVLQNELRIKDAVIESLTTRVAMLEDENAMNVSTGGGGGGGGKKAKSRAAPVVRESCGGGVIAHRSNSIPTMSTVIDDKGRHSAKMGTRESLGTSKILEAIPEAVKTREQLIAEKFVGVFQQPLDHIAYLQSAQFANELIEVCEAVEAVLEEEPRVIFMQSPVYVIGDIHGNLEDLHFFADNIWKLGMDLTAGKFLFLGDYVDRGMSSLECVAYLFALKLLHPRKIYLLRGNHETRDVNGWEEHYHEKSFIFQCKDRFGASIGEKVWEECNQTFDRLPLAAVIDHDIFCIHGGIPRPVKQHDSEIQAILSLPNVAAVMPSYDHEEDWMKQVAGDCIWSDPASEELEPHLPASGFGESPRGGGAVCFGSRAIDNFLDANGLSYIIRAHEAHAHGVSIAKSARVFTVFSTSKDHRQGGTAMAGCILVDNYLIQAINRSPKYRNKYVHRRTSLSVAHVPKEEVRPSSPRIFLYLSISLHLSFSPTSLFHHLHVALLISTTSFLFNYFYSYFYYPTNSSRFGASSGSSASPSSRPRRHACAKSARLRTPALPPPLPPLPRAQDAAPATKRTLLLAPTPPSRFPSRILPLPFFFEQKVLLRGMKTELGVVGLRRACPPLPSLLKCVIKCRFKIWPKTTHLTLLPPLTLRAELCRCCPGSSP